jgi:CheY-like chemotaxis protein
MIGANLRSDSNLFTTSFIAPRHSQAFSQSQSQSQAESQSESVTAIDEGTAGIAYMENPLARIHTITETEAFTAASRDENEIAPTSSTTVNTAAVVFNQQRQHTSIAPSSSTVISTTSPGLSASNSLSVLSTTAAAGSATANGSGGVALKASTSPKRNFSFNAAGVLSSALSSSSSNSKGSGNNLPTTGIASAGIANRSSPALKQRFGFLVSGLDINHSHSSSPHAAANNKNNNNSNHSNHSASSTSNRLNQSQLQLQPQQLQLQQQLQQQSSSSSSSSLLQCPPSSCPEVILMDFVMPNLSGPAATEKIRHMGYRGVIIGVTGNALTEDVEYFMRSGANAVLTKPLDINEMLRIIENRQQSDGATGGGKGGGWRQKK